MSKFVLIGMTGEPGLHLINLDTGTIQPIAADAVDESIDKMRSNGATVLRGIDVAISMPNREDAVGASSSMADLSADLIEGLLRRHSTHQARTVLSPLLSGFGITRVAQQTGLDTIGIPCHAAIRPNSRTLAVHQGKGSDDDGAWVSAVMEAAECAVAERPSATARLASLERLAEIDVRHHLCSASLPHGCSPTPAQPITWLTGRSLRSGEPVLVPLDAVAIAPCAEEGLPFAQSSNGLAAGFTEAEATVHALCELIERDALTLWSLVPKNECRSRAIDHLAAVGSAASQAIDSISRSGLRLRLFDLTTDVGVPVVMAMIWGDDPKLWFDVASGLCAHPSSERAIVGAIQEAAQTRISNIAGARDDIGSDEYEKPLPDWLGALVETGPTDRGPPRRMSDQGFAALPAVLGDSLIVVPLTATDDPVCVVKLVSERLEDRPTNQHWRPGPRAVLAMSRLR